MNAQLKPEVTPGLCCCHWDFTRDVRLTTDRTCSVHGEYAQSAERRKLQKDREGAALAVQIHRTEARVWLDRLRRSKRRLAELNKQLEVP